MKKLKIIQALIALLVSLPIWFYLLHEVLERVQATELMWFLFWVYVPVSIFATFIGKLIEGEA